MQIRPGSGMDKSRPSKRPRVPDGTRIESFAIRFAELSLVICVIGIAVAILMLQTHA